MPCLLLLFNWLSKPLNHQDILMFQKCIVVRRFYISFLEVKMKYSLPRAYAVFCGTDVSKMHSNEANLYFFYRGKDEVFTTTCICSILWYCSFKDA